MDNMILATDAYLALGDSEQALSMIGGFFKLSKKHGVFDIGMRAKVTHGRVLAARERWGQAQEVFAETISQGQNRKDFYSLCDAHIRLGEIERMRGRTVSAAANYRKALRLARKKGFNGFARSALKALRKL